MSLGLTSRLTCSYCLAFFFISMVGRRNSLLNLPNAIINNVLTSTLKRKKYIFKKKTVNSLEHESTRHAETCSPLKRKSYLPIYSVTFSVLERRKRELGWFTKKEEKVNLFRPFQPVGSVVETWRNPINRLWLSAGRAVTTCCYEDTMELLLACLAGQLVDSK